MWGQFLRAMMAAAAGELGRQVVKNATKPKPKPKPRKSYYKG